jgi:hypothetical protein
MEILEFVERLSGMMPDYIITQLKKEPIINLVSQIIDESDKSPGDALIIFVTAVKYLWGRRNAFAEMEERDSFREFVRANRDSIVELAVRKRMQANVPTRAFPLIEVINKKIKGLPVAVIELGASYGLLGWTLLEVVKIIENRDRYFSPEQKIPSNPRPIDYYLGIELEIPDKEWFLACLSDHTTESYLTNFINDIPHESEKFNLIQASAFGFSDLEPVKRLTEQPYTLVVLTSFIFFQIGIKRERKLKNEILKFTRDTGSYWISQVVKHPPNSTDTHYYIEWNGERIIESFDPICSYWKWLTD